MLSDGEDVVLPGQSEGLAVQDEVNVGQGVDGVAVHEELPSAGHELHTSTDCLEVTQTLSRLTSNLPVDGADLIHWTHQEAGASVHNADTAWYKALSLDLTRYRLIDSLPWQPMVSPSTKMPSIVIFQYPGLVSTST